MLRRLAIQFIPILDVNTSQPRKNRGKYAEIDDFLRPVVVHNFMNEKEFIRNQISFVICLLWRARYAFYCTPRRKKHGSTWFSMCARGIQWRSQEHEMIRQLICAKYFCIGSLNLHQNIWREYIYGCIEARYSSAYIGWHPRWETMHVVTTRRSQRSKPTLISYLRFPINVAAWERTSNIEESVIGDSMKYIDKCY